MSSPSLREPDTLAAYAFVERVLADQLGLSLAAYSDALVQMVLAALPRPIDVHSPALLRTLVTAFGIGETSFLRHPEHFEALRALAPSLPGAGRRPLELWSAGCATGEEAYSLAATQLGARVRGSDVNAASIERARDGSYRLWSLRGVRMEDVDGWLEVAPLDVRVREVVRGSVRFDVCNLVHDPYPSGLDAVFCRNVLLYFRPEAAHAVYERLAAAVHVGGVLFIGYGDPEPPAPCWRAEHVDDVRFFRRVAERGSSSACARVVRRAPEPSAESAVRRIERDPAFEESQEMLSLVRGLAGQRELDRALELLERVVQTQRLALAVEAHVLTAFIADEAGRHKLAVDAARRACFLAPTDPVPLYLLGAALCALGATDLARDRMRQALEALTRYPDPSVPLPYGEGLTGHQLRRMIRVRLDAL